MAQLAIAAKMSVGHIYRYFPSKDNIIAAVVERDVAIVLADFDLLEVRQDEMIPAFLKAWRFNLEQMCDPDRSALWLEILAEAGRNPHAAQLVRSARESVGKRFEALVAAGSSGRWTPAEAASKARLLLALTDAMAFSVVAESSSTPTQMVDEVLSCAERLLS